jgi:CheY-like chemotaxis protein
MATTHILIIEDEPIILEAYTLALRSRGFKVTAACNGFKAIKSALSDTPDLLLTDYNLPDMTGAEILATLRTHYPLLPAILATGNTTIDLCEYKERGFEDCLRKPVLTEELIRSVQSRILNAKGTVMRITDLRISAAAKLKF